MLAYPMSSTSSDETIGRQETCGALRRRRAALRTSLFDKVTSFLAALMLLLGSFALALAAIWMLSVDPEVVLLPPPPVTWGSPSVETESTEFLVPQAEELVELQDPNLRDALLAVTHAASQVAGVTEVGFADDGSELSGGDPDGNADRRMAPPSQQDGTRPRFQRWQIDFEARDVDAYARQLEHFGIELGVVGGGIAGIDYVGKPASEVVTRHGDSGSEKRLYFIWHQENPLQRFDRLLLQRAGVGVNQREIVKFIPPVLENQLAQIELEYAMARGRSFNSIDKTVFFCEAGSDGYRFVVREQRYRKQKD